MKIIVTGMNGTVAPVLAGEFAAGGHSVVPRNRTALPPESAAACQEFIAASQPGALCHLATGSADRAEMLAQSCAAVGVRFLYTGSLSVFSISHRVHSAPS